MEKRFTKGLVIERKLKEIESYIYKDVVDLATWNTKEGQYAGYGEYSDIDTKEDTISTGDRWVCKDYLTRWFSKTITIPQSYDGKKVVLLLDFGGEGVVKINNDIVSSLTSCISERGEKRHRVIVSKSAVGGTSIVVEAEMNLNYMEFAREHRIKGETQTFYTFSYAKLAVVNEEVESYYFDLKTAYDALCVLNNPLHNLLNSITILPPEVQRIFELSSKDSFIAEKIEAAIVNSVSEIDFNFEDAVFYGSLLRAKSVLHSQIESIQQTANMLITFTGQGHIDTAWRWVIHESVRKTRNTMANVIDLMEEYPDFVFAFSQPQLFEFVKDHYPDLYEKVKIKVASGQLELIGNSWVEMDANIPSGESFVRQLLYGIQFFKSEFGKASSVFWMPDVFGYSWALPQIIKRSGMKYFFTSKLANNDTNNFPYSLFQWQGIDGTRLMSYVQRLNYNGIYEPETINSIYAKFPEKKHTENLLMTFGYGDGGGGPTYEMLEVGKRMENFPGFQKTKLGSAESFFDNNDKNFEKLPVWNDEMYFEHHRGTYTTQAKTKKANRKNELLYRSAEILASLAKKFNSQEYPYKDFLAGYKKLLTNQFHDILPGSSIDTVYEYAEADYEFVKNIGDDIFNTSANSLLKCIPHNESDIVVFNTLSWQRSEYVQVCIDQKDICVFDVDGNNVIPSSLTNKGGKLYLEFVAENVPAMGYKVFSLAPIEEKQKKSVGIAKDKCNIESDYYVIRLDEAGNIRSIFDKEEERSILSNSTCPSVIKIFEDKPGNETAWNIDLEYQNKEWLLLEGTSELELNTEHKAVLKVKRKFNKSTIEQSITVYKDNRRIDFDTTVDWQETEKMLKAEFNVDIHSTKAAYEIQFGAIERPTHWNTSYDRAKFEVCGHKWADLSEADYGVALLNDCKYGYDIKDSRMRITLLRSPIDPDLNADKGEHNFLYSLFPHKYDWKHANVVKEGYTINVPLFALSCSESSVGNLNKGSGSFISCSTDNVVIDTVKCAEDKNGLIVRVYESIGKKTNVAVASILGIKTVHECNLIEDNEQQIEVSQNAYKFTIKPFEVKTFRLV